MNTRARAHTHTLTWVDPKTCMHSTRSPCPPSNDFPIVELNPSRLTDHFETCKSAEFEKHREASYLRFLSCFGVWNVRSLKKILALYHVRSLLVFHIYYFINGIHWKIVDDKWRASKIHKAPTRSHEFAASNEALNIFIYECMQCSQSMEI